MTLRTFRLKVAKSFGIRKADQSAMRLWLKMSGGTVSDLDDTQDTQDVSWLGFEDGSEILLYSAAK